MTCQRLLVFVLSLAAAGVLSCTSPGASCGRKAPGGAASSSAAPDIPPGALIPISQIPDDVALLAELEQLMERYQRDRFDRLLDAVDPGELIEHATLTQMAIDRGLFGPDALFAVGDELFDYEFRPNDGLGNGLSSRTTMAGARPAPNMRVVHEGEFGGPDAYSCMSCHAKGGLDGAGTATQNAFLRGDGLATSSADVRNPPHLLGLGPVEALAAEMTAELAAQVETARARAAASRTPIEIALTAKDIEFGTMRVLPSGELDTRGVRGVDPDLVIKPFGWKGHQATIRAISEESFRIHMGMVSMRVQELARDSAGNTGQDSDRAIYGDGPWQDLDRDGVPLEIEDGMLTTMTAYLAQLEIPIIRPPADPRHLQAFGRGSELFDRIGCPGCHRRELILRNPIIQIRPQQPSHANRKAIPIDVARHGEAPKIEPVGPNGSAYRVMLFSDLKRHHMGPELATPAGQGGAGPEEFLTRPLWGLAETAPYLHDGRAPTVHDAIRLHGGEAAAARDAYLALPEADRGALRVFLLSLTRTPRLAMP